MVDGRVRRIDAASTLQQLTRLSVVALLLVHKPHLRIMMKVTCPILIWNTVDLSDGNKVVGESDECLNTKLAHLRFGHDGIVTDDHTALLPLMSRYINVRRSTSHLHDAKAAQIVEGVGTGVVGIQNVGLVKGPKRLAKLAQLLLCRCHATVQ